MYFNNFVNLTVGSMQDYNYLYHGCMEVTVELECCKYPAIEKIQNMWEDNRKVKDCY